MSKQIQQRAPIGKIFARWHLLAIAIASRGYKSSRRTHVSRVNAGKILNYTSSINDL